MTSSDITRATLDEVFAPRGIAIVGVSTARMAFAEMVMGSLMQAGYLAIYPVNPKYEEVQGLRCYPNLLAIPGIVDHVVVNIPAEAALDLLDDCARKGVKSVHFFTAGFGESGYADRADLELKMLAKARESGFRIIGPNCIGIHVPKNRVTNSLGAPVKAGPVAFMSQSGGHAQNMPGYGDPRGIYFSKVVSYGNALDVNEIELIEYFAEDGDTSVIGAYIEGIKDGARFTRALKKAAAKKPVIIYKGGKTEAGKRAAHGHTASMTSSADVFQAFCRQANTIQVDNIDELLDAMVALCYLKSLPKGRKLALVGAGGGPSVLAGDEIEKEGLLMPCFSGAIQEELKKRLPIAGSIFINPLDTPNLTAPEAIAAAMEILGRSADIDMLVYHLGFHPIGNWGYGRFSDQAYLKAVTETLVAARESSGKPVLLALRLPLNLEGMTEFLGAQKVFVGAGLPVFYSMQQLARTMCRLITWQDNRIKAGLPAWSNDS